MPQKPTLPALSSITRAPVAPRAATARSAARSRAAVATLRAALAATVIVLPVAARAQSASQEPDYGFSGRIGMLAVSTPTYEGSPNRRTLVAPTLSLSYRTREWGSVEFGPRGLVWNAIDQDRFRFGLVAQFDPGRKDSDPAKYNPIPGDKRLAGMGRVKASTQFGLAIGYGPLTLVTRQSVTGDGPKGAQAEMTAEFPWAVSDRLNLRFAVGATWANRNYMQTYFGVTQAQSTASGFAVYTPKSGCQKVEASVGGEYALAPRWKLQGNLSVSQLGDVAADSPLVGGRGALGRALDVGRRTGTTLALGVAHEF